MLGAPYQAQHDRVRLERGRAREHACVACGQTADEWALKPGTPDLLEAVVRGFVLEYSLDVNAYQPMCRSCHRRMDLPQMCRKGLHPYRENAAPNGRYRACGECRRERNAADYQRRKASA